LRVWVDIDNPPQVQYLAPLARAFEKSGANVVVTARDLGMTLDLLRRREMDFVAVDAGFGKSKASKAVGLARRSWALRALWHKRGRPHVLISASRSSALAARAMGIPAFVVCDYEHVHLEIYRRLRSHLLFPDVIDRSVFTKRGFEEAHLVSFRGLKEDVTFADLTPEEIAPHPFPQVRDGQIRLLFRPPAEESHYYTPRSGSIAIQLLERLAADPRVVVVFSPRYEWQPDQLKRLTWKSEPIVLHRPLPAPSLLAGVDLVVSGGGTMLREAAYLGVPAYSLFQGTVGAVDRYLESIGRLRIVRSGTDLGLIELTKARPKPFLRTNPELVTELIETIGGRVR
jgi:hypothetical protein